MLCLLCLQASCPAFPSPVFVKRSRSSLLQHRHNPCSLTHHPHHYQLSNQMTIYHQTETPIKNTKTNSTHFFPNSIVTIMAHTLAPHKQINNQFLTSSHDNYMRAMAPHIWEVMWHHIFVKSCGTTYLSSHVAPHICQVMWHHIFVKSCGTTYLGSHVAPHICQVMWHHIFVKSCGTTYLSSHVAPHIWEVMWHHIFVKSCGTTYL